MLRDERFYQTRYDDPLQRAIWENSLRRTTTLYPIARRDPIFTPIFTSLFASFGFSAATTGLLAAGATAIATTAISIGIQMLMAPKPPKPEDGKVPKLQSIPHRWWGVGRNRVGGAFMLWEAKGSTLFSVQAIAGHRIKSVNRYWLHDDEVELQPDGTIVDGTSYATRVKIYSRLGLVPETPYAPIVARLGAEGVWTNNHRGDGQASIAMTCKNAGAEKQQKRFPYGPPQLSVEADMALCWDFRDPLQNPENPSTWQWTRNSAVIMAWHQCFNEFGHKRDYRRAILPVLDMWQEEADVCDELVALKGGGFERRYECNGFDTTENDPKAATNAILSSCDGWLCDRGDGALLFIVGKFREKYVTTLTDADLVGHQIEYDVLFEDECNRLVPKFCYPEIGYATSDTDFYEDTGAQLTAGRILTQDANYQWVQQWRQARRLGKRDWLRLQEKVTGQLNVRLAGINSIYSRWVRLNTPLSLPRLNGKVIENRKSVLSLLQGGFNMEIMRHPENIDAWNPTTDEGRQPPVPQRVTKDEIPVPVINLVQAKPRGDSVYIRVVLIDPEDDSLYPVVRYRVADDGSGSPGAWIEQKFPNATPVSGFINLGTNVVPSDTMLDIQAAYISADGDYGVWSVTANVASTVDPVAPQSLQSFIVSDSAPRLGRAKLTVVTKNDARVRSVNIYRVASGAAFDPNTSSPIATLAVGPSSSYSYTDGDETRTNLLGNPGFDTDTVWAKGTGWTISGGTANKAVGNNTLITQSAAIAAGKKGRLGFDITAFSAGSCVPRLTNGTNNYEGVARSAVGSYRDTVTSVVATTTAAIRGSATFVGSIDNVILYEETATSAPQGIWDYYAVPLNGSNIPGPSIGPASAIII